MKYLVGTDSVHTTAAICDYLEDRATSDDAVRVVAAHSGDETARRDGREALNVASVRLASVGDLETALLEGPPAAVLLEAAADVDEIVVGVHGGAPDADTAVGSTVQRLLETASRPVVVVPIPALE